MDYESIKALIELVDKSNIGEVKIKQDDFKLIIRHKDYHPKGVQTIVAPVSAPISTPVVAASVPSQSNAQAAPAPAQEETKAPQAKEDTSKYIEIKSPMIGTFYRSSSPESPPFVKIGDVVKKGAVLGIIEAMKLFNEIESETEGTIVKVLVDNATPIEYDQALFLIDPS